MSQTSHWNPLKVFNIHQIKEFANIPNRTLKELKCSWANSDSMFHISVAVAVPRVTCPALSPAGDGIQSVTVAGGGVRGGFLAIWIEAQEQRVGLRALSDPKRLLTHIWCRRWHFTSLSCQTGIPRVCVCLTCMYYVCSVLCSNV